MRKENIINSFINIMTKGMKFGQFLEWSLKNNMLEPPKEEKNMVWSPFKAKVKRLVKEPSEQLTISKLRTGTTFEYNEKLYIKLKRDGYSIPHDTSGSYGVNVTSGVVTHFASITEVRVCETSVEYNVLSVREYYDRM